MNVLRDQIVQIRTRFYTRLFTIVGRLAAYSLLAAVSWKAALGCYLLMWTANLGRR